MTTTRQITALLSRHLGVDVAPWAARLVREGVGALKTLLRDDLLRERNAFARDVMADIESQKAQQ